MKERRKTGVRWRDKEVKLISERKYKNNKNENINRGGNGSERKIEREKLRSEGKEGTQE